MNSANKSVAFIGPTNLATKKCSTGTQLNPFIRWLGVTLLTGVPGSMSVTWTTFNKTESVVEYGLLGGRLFEMSTKGEWTLFVDSGVEKRKMFIHRVTLTGLKPAATYGE